MNSPIRHLAKVCKNSSRMFSSIPQSSYLPAADVKHRVINCISSLQSSPSNILEHSHFVVDLGFDSLERKQIISNITDEFRIKINEKDASSLLSVSDVINYIAANPKAR